MTGDSQSRTVSRYIFEPDFVDKASHRIKIACKGIATKSKCLKRNRAASSERIYYKWRILRISGTYQTTTDFKISPICRQIPVGKITNET